MTDYDRAKAVAASYGQEHLFEYYDGLSESEKQILVQSVLKTDFSVLANLDGGQNAKRGKLSPADALTLKEIEKDKQKLENCGLDALRRGEVAAVLLAGGQGTRLGSALPKGMYDIGVTRELTIFNQQWNNIFEVTKKAGVQFHIFIMTSEGNDGVTRSFFESKNYFGYDRDKIHFFVQDVTPACSADGKIYLEEKYKVALSPNGNGGWYSSLVNSGLDKIIASENIKWLNVYSVDNVLQRICDPVFIGATLESGCASSGKVVKKVSPEEKVGVLCKEDGLPAIVEYYEMDKETACLRDADGELTYRFGVTLNYLFNVRKLNEIYKSEMPYHIAKKAVAHIENGVKVKPETPDGYKFETLVVDMIKKFGSCLAVEVDRRKEFAPVKNKTGVDSVDSARALLEENGVKL